MITAENDFRIDLSLLGEVRYRTAPQLPQDERGNLRCRELTLLEADFDDSALAIGVAPLTADPEREQPGLVANIIDALAHEALHRVHGPPRIGQQATPGLAAYEDGMIYGCGHY